MATVAKACLIVMGLGLAWAYPPELGGDGEDLDDHRPYRGFSSYRGFNSYRGKTYKDPDDNKPYRGFSSYRGLNSYRGKTDSKVPCEKRPNIICENCAAECKESNCGCKYSHCQWNQPEAGPGSCFFCGDNLCADGTAESEPKCLGIGEVCKTDVDCCSDSFCAYTNTNFGHCWTKSKPTVTTTPRIPAKSDSKVPCEKRPNIGCENCQEECDKSNCGCTHGYCDRSQPGAGVCVFCGDFLCAETEGTESEQTLNKLFEAMMRRLQSGKSIKFKVDVKNPEAILGSEDNSARSFY